MPRLTSKMKFNCHSLKLDDVFLFKNGSKIPAFVTRPFLTMLSFEVDIIFLQQLHYERNGTDYPVNYTFFLIGYCGHPNFPYTKYSTQASQ